MKPRMQRLIGIAVFTLLFPATAPLIQYIPNPMVPGALVALNMILPVLAGHFYGPLSGAVAGGVGCFLTALWLANKFYAVSVFSLTVRGAVAGWIGKYRSAERNHVACAVSDILIRLLGDSDRTGADHNRVRTGFFHRIRERHKCVPRNIHGGYGRIFAHNLDR